MHLFFKHLACRLLLAAVIGGGVISSLPAQQADSSQHPLLEARQLMLSYHYQQAIPLLLTAAGTDSTAAEARWLLGQCYSQTGQTAAAKGQLQQLLEVEPAHQPAWSLLGGLYLRETHYGAAADCYDQALALDSTNAYYHRQRASIASRQGALSLAMHHYQQALALNEHDVESLTELAELWLKTGNAAQSSQLLLQGLALDSANLRLWRLQARVAYRQKAYQAVVSAMEYPLAAGDTSHYYLQLLGISHFHLGRYPEAIRWLDFLQQQGVDTEVLNYYLGLSYRNNGQPEKAIVLLEKAVKKGMSENLGHYYTQLAVSYEEKGDHGKAIQAYQLAYKDSGDRLLLYHLARNYDRYYKDKKVALRYYEKFLVEVDTVNTGYQDYARYRASQLKEHIHFSADTL
ncbi:tetratricopeptide repeat protein [Cesiribacter andamanensis]|uniref:Tetratricopeptide repeat protein n=1 Tax=Cesiribacter andamanensis AMV16 TaxID=1279009 RepID=M7P154_9BACT|nr:tetratricopeptide repeat protein [Cesiribacter andamanensis]EMR04314.1 tetratricopeptide repeat protein [Cesiribacter andamanensis AMV16]